MSTMMTCDDVRWDDVTGDDDDVTDDEDDVTDLSDDRCQNGNGDETAYGSFFR